MKKHVRLVNLFLVLVAVLGTAKQASAQFQVRVEQPGSAAVTVPDGGCDLGGSGVCDIDSAAGSILFGLGPYGGYGFISVSVVSKPNLGNSTTAEINQAVISASSVTGGTLVVTVADTGFG